jgi:hypothetical protein
LRRHLPRVRRHHAGHLHCGIEIGGAGGSGFSDDLAGRGIEDRKPFVVAGLAPLAVDEQAVVRRRCIRSSTVEMLGLSDSLSG